MNIPKDPAILLSYVNTKLRDEFPDLSEMCVSLDISRTDIETELSKIGYHYDEKRNCFA